MLSGEKNIRKFIDDKKGAHTRRLKVKVAYSSPKELWNLPMIQELHAEGGVSMHTSAICKLTSLEKLTLYESMHGLNRNIGCLTALKSLTLKGCALRDLPSEIGCLVNLEELHAQYNNLKRLPTSIVKLTQLHTLNLYTNKFEYDLPYEIYALTNLRHLNLDFNKLTKIDDQIQCLTKLQTLSLRENDLVTVSSAIEHCTALTYLDLSDNAYSRFTKLGIPMTVTKLYNLETLKLSGTNTRPDTIHIKFITELSYMPKLKYVTLPDFWFRDGTIPTCTYRIWKLEGQWADKSLPHLEMSDRFEKFHKAKLALIRYNLREQASWALLALFDQMLLSKGKHPISAKIFLLNDSKYP